MQNKNKRLVSIYCDAIGFSLLKFIFELKSSNINVSEVVFDRRASPLYPSVLAQKENQIRAGITSDHKKINILHFLKRRMSQVCSLIILQVVPLHLRVISQSTQLGSLNPDCVLVMHSASRILSAHDLSLIKSDIINIHPAELPFYRGLDSQFWALADNHRQGVTGYLVDTGIDTGRIIKFLPLDEFAGEGGQKNIDIRELKGKLNKLKYSRYADIIQEYFLARGKFQRPTIERSQNRGVFPAELYPKYFLSSSDGEN